MVVFDDADPAQVAEAIKIGGYWNSGQDCTAASRVLVGPKIYDKLLEELVPAVESMKVGDPAEGDDIEMGPVISKAQQDRVLGFLDRAKGAKVLTGGGTNGDRGFFVKPTVVADVDQDGRDRAARGLRAGRLRAAVRGRRRGDRVGERRALRARGLGLHARRRPRAERRAQARVRDGLDQRPHPARLGDAARRLQAVGLRQGPVAVLDRGLHADQARDGQAGRERGVEEKSEHERARSCAERRRPARARHQALRRRRRGRRRLARDPAGSLLRPARARPAAARRRRCA